MDTRCIYITGSQSVRLQRMARMGDVLTAVSCDQGLLPLDTSIHCANDVNADALMAKLGISERYPLELLVPNVDSRRWSKDLRTCVLSSELPAHAFLELRSGKDEERRITMPDDTRIFIVGPGLALLQAAHEMEAWMAREQIDKLHAFFELLSFADECCGSYYRDPLKPRGGTVFYDERNNCTRFCTADELREFVAQIKNVDGLSLAQVVARYAIDESGSGMETYVNHACTLPPRYGGLSMRLPLANKQLQVSEEVWKKLKHGSLRPDLQWPEQHMLAEYFGDKEHAGKAARVEDKNRMQDYAIAKYTAFPLMFDDVKNASALAKTALMLAEEFMRHGVKGEKYRVKRLLNNPDFLAKQRVLISCLLPPVLRYGS